MLFFARFKYWLVSPGIKAGNAWGIIILKNPCFSEIPKLRKASHWPKGTDWIPPRITSAINALENTLKPNNNAENSEDKLSPNSLWNKNVYIDLIFV